MRRTFLYIGILFTSALLLHCPSTPTKVDDGYIIVTEKGVDRDDAELNAKKKILEIGLGALIEGESKSTDGQLDYREIYESVEGYVTHFTIIKEKDLGDAGYQMKAKGRVNRKALKNALEERLKTIGKPRFMVLIKEDFFGTLREPGDSITEKELVVKFPDFEFMDRNQFQKIIAREGGEIIGAYDDPTAQEKALKVAAEQGVDFLLVGRTKVIQGAEVMNSGMFSIQSTVEYKIIDVGTARIIAANNSSGAYPHINKEQGAQKSIQKGIDSSANSIVSQVMKKWKAGRTIRLVIEGITYDEYLEKEMDQIIRKIKGVNSVNERNTRGPLVLEVQAMFDGTRLYKRLIQAKKDMNGINFTSKEVKGGQVHIQITQK
ncbi:MAG: hypothetical protein H7A25_13410 [Leptospiraceae bacterium]|nr:hypothetical protein [Leptospiraceae bacterium]